jgi:predicted nucleic acid-binding protein
MIAVANQSPLCYLILICEIDLLPKLFDAVLLPHAVLAELLQQDAPPTVRVWASQLPAWVSVQAIPAMSISGLEKLQIAEQSAILLAESSSGGIIVLDEKAARRIAADRGLQVMGLLGLLELAAASGFVELSPAIDRLRRTNFRASSALLKKVLDRQGNK